MYYSNKLFFYCCTKCGVSGFVPPEYLGEAYDSKALPFEEHRIPYFWHECLEGSVGRSDLWETNIELIKIRNHLEL